MRIVLKSIFKVWVGIWTEIWKRITHLFLILGSIFRILKPPASPKHDPEKGPVGCVKSYLPAHGFTPLTSLLTLPIEPLQHKDFQVVRQFDAVVLIHGTFVGSDPLAIVSLLDYYFHGTALHTSAQKAIKNLTQRTISKQSDLGNFTEEYCQEFQRISKVPTTLFSWSSSNFHLARLRAAFELKALLCSQFRNKKVLFISHSHGGQVLALFSHLLMPKKSELLQSLLTNEYILNQFGHPEMLMRDLSTQSRLHFFVNLGCPHRYSWQADFQSRILHISNYRAGSKIPLDGILFTRYGDYIQQLGTLGSDFGSILPHENEANLWLDQLLGVGANLKVWRQFLNQDCQLSPFGQNFLVDYRDESRSFKPNFHQTLFGHGNYTKKINISATLKMISSHLRECG